MRKGDVLTILLAIGIAIWTPLTAEGVDATWIGNDGDLWSDASKWDPAAVPDATATFDGTGGVMGVVDMNGEALTVLDMYLSFAANGYDINDDAAGGGLLTVTNIYHSAGGTNTISGVVSMTGGAIAVSNGTLQLTNASNSIDAATTIAVETGGTLEARASTLGAASVTLDGGTASLSIGGGGGQRVGRHQRAGALARRQRHSGRRYGHGQRCTGDQLEGQVGCGQSRHKWRRPHDDRIHGRNDR